MRHTHLRTIIISGTVLLIGLFIVQAYWFRKAFDVAEQQFDHSVQIALRKVADSVSDASEITKLSSNFFFVTVNRQLNDKDIDTRIKNEFLLRNLDIEYELGVYNAYDDTLVYGHYVEATIKRGLVDIEHFNPSKKDAEKNFAIYFPKKKSYLAAELDIWIFSTVLLLLMTSFFAYAIASLLREKKFAELKNDFINNMTHEFKTPVTNIRIAGEILNGKVKNMEGAAVYVDILLKENEKLSQKIDGILTGANGHLRKPVFEKIDVHQLIRNCAEAFQLRVQERNGNIQLDFGAKNASIFGDRELLTQAINNVIDNAEKYSRNQPVIMVRTRDNSRGIEIDIVDEGIGISRDMQTKVFEKFFRIKTGDVHDVKGFGLGLNFARNVIWTHRGKIDLVSELNGGTEVTIFLPA